tara:strand:+ start:77 stop:685 length:609 start_codon:yes stop_codon:yes gene_type:complete
LVTVGVNVNMKAVMKQIHDLQKNRIPSAIAKGLNLTGEDINKRLKFTLPQYIDRPTPFTLNAFGLTFASKTRQRARVFIKDIQAQYLIWQIKGGSRSAGGRGTGVPVRGVKKLNQFGNIPGRRGGLVKGKKQYIATIGGRTGVWERTGGKTNPTNRLMVGFHKRVSYRARWPYYKLVKKIYEERVARNMIKGARFALRKVRK